MRRGNDPSVVDFINATVARGMHRSVEEMAVGSELVVDDGF